MLKNLKSMTIRSEMHDIIPCEPKSSSYCGGFVKEICKKAK